MPTIILPEDTWFYLSRTFLESKDIRNLSITSRALRRHLLPITFRVLTFRGFTNTCRHTIPSLFAHFRRMQEFIHYVRSYKIIFSVIHRVEVRNWVDYTLLDVSQDVIISEACLEKLKGLWRATYQCLVALINDIPNLRHVAFYETATISKPSEPLFPDRSFRPYEPFNRSQSVEFQLREIGEDSPGFIVPSFVEAGWISGEPGRPSDAPTYRYFSDILEYTPSILVSAKLYSPVIISLSHSTIAKFKSIRRLAVAVYPAIATLSIINAVDYSNVNAIFANTPNLRHLSVVPFRWTVNPFVIPLNSMPKLESYMGPSELWTQIFCGRAVRELYLLEYWTGRSSYLVYPAKAAFPILNKMEAFTVDSRIHIRVLDIVHFASVSAEQLKTLAIALPNLEVLGLRRDRGSKSSTTEFVRYLDAVSPFLHLQKLHVFCWGNATVDITALPAMCRHHPSPSLTEIQFISVCTARWRADAGWIYYPDSMGTIVNSHAVCELESDDELWTILEDSVHPKIVEAGPSKG
ncbi:hypothetical protein M422DRAFT_39812 [Sphaerobolus stellatus SS14]|uniref:Unplaced genomic scaffold SPHSTscaffold_736, whole genome shotgun sequence n=1 Tax=Sphaerobolus stellatus (strain SS14) TaxID=990650 RepID=A0A0C9UC98_SPHS4|nr:hypothetical protein M422DRAFT_39812 [Sphaerobolus stellatus SS14]